MCKNRLVSGQAASGPAREMARVTGLEPATSGVTGRHSNQLSYTRTFPGPAVGGVGALYASPYTLSS